MVKFPYYIIRQYERIFTQGKYKCIETAKNRYVLDYSDEVLKDSSYSKRRLNLLADNGKPYGLYPINHVVRNITQMIGYGGKVFYTDQGELVNWIKGDFYDVKDHLVQSSWINKGKWLVEIKDVGTIESSRYNEELYAKIVHFGKQRLLYGFTNTKGTKPLRIKL